MLPNITPCLCNVSLKLKVQSSFVCNRWHWAYRNHNKQRTKQLTHKEQSTKYLHECESCIWVASSDVGDRWPLKKQNCSMVSKQGCSQNTADARAQYMGTLIRLRVTSYPGPAQLIATCSWEMQKQTGGCPPRKFWNFWASSVDSEATLGHTIAMNWSTSTMPSLRTCARAA